MLFDEVWLLQFVLGQAFNPERTHRLKTDGRANLKGMIQTRDTRTTCAEMCHLLLLLGFCSNGMLRLFLAQIYRFQRAALNLFLLYFSTQDVLNKVHVFVSHGLNAVLNSAFSALKRMRFLTREAKLSRPTFVKNLQKTESRNAFGLILWGAPPAAAVLLHGLWLPL